MENTLASIFHGGVQISDGQIPDLHRVMLGSSGPVAQWTRHRPTEPEIAGSSPAGVNATNTVEFEGHDIGLDP